MTQEMTLKLQSRHFPPVAHHFSGGRFDRFALESLPEPLRMLGQDAPRKLTPRIFQHENIQVGGPSTSLLTCFVLVWHES
jgi:hypothetical protein